MPTRRYCVGTWYFSPYPEEVTRQSKTLYIDEFTLRFFPSERAMHRFQRKSPFRHPPGDEIYRDGNISVFEVDGRKEVCFPRHGSDPCYMVFFHTLGERS